MTQETATALPNPETKEGQEQLKALGIKPNPVPDDLTRPFWEAAARRELRIQRCTNCGELRHLPRQKCLECGSTDVEWTQLSGKGTIYSFIVDHRDRFPGFDGSYVVAMVVPVEAKRDIVRFMGNILECDYNDVYMDMPVEVVFQEIKPGVVLPQWRPAPEAKLKSRS